MKSFCMCVYDFFRGVLHDLRSIGWRKASLLVFAVMSVYGILLANPTTAYDFNSAKGDSFQVFLTYFFMRRFMQGAIACLFHDFSPFWNWSIGLALIALFAALLYVLAKRLRIPDGKAIIFSLLWISTPFFFNRSIFQHAMPAEPFAFCLDALVLLCFCDMRERDLCRGYFCKFALATIMTAMAASVYQAHINLLLTAMLGVCIIDIRKEWNGFFKDVLLIITMLFAGVALWGVINFGPVVIARMLGVVIPPSGGAHDTVYWFEGGMPFSMRLAGFFVSLVLNWGYDAFFVVGLRYVLLSLLFVVIFSMRCIVNGKKTAGVAILVYGLSIFAMPCLQGSADNLRIYYCLGAFVAFSGLILLTLNVGCHVLRIMCFLVVGLAIFRMAHETSTLYYYQWKTKNHDRMHMENVALDLWRQYGKNIDKPVAVIGGWDHNPTCWSDMRPNREMPLLHHPFSDYSNMTDFNVPREFYVVAREKVGLVVKMPEDKVYDELKRINKDVVPAYPQNGYIFETDNEIVVNLGSRKNKWTGFSFDNFRSPNEELLFKTIGKNKIDAIKLKMAKPFLELARKYPWAIVDA